MYFFRYCLSTALITLAATAVQADVMFQCVDEDGHKTFSNVKPAGKGVRCTTMDLGPATSVPAPKPAAKTPSPASFPKVGENTQKERDTDRRRILESELDAEQKNLEQAKKDLAEQESQRGGSADRLVPYRERVGQHERNIQAIQRELTNLK